MTEKAERRAGEMRIGADELLKEFGGAMHVAEAMLLGEISDYRLTYVSDVVSTLILDAAKWRLEHPDLTTVKPLKQRRGERTNG